MNEEGSKLVPPETSVTLLAFTTGEALLTSGARPGSLQRLRVGLRQRDAARGAGAREAPQSTAALHEQHIRSEALDA